MHQLPLDTLINKSFTGNMQKKSLVKVSNVAYYLDNVISSFSDFLEHRGVSVKTRRNYKSDARQFLRWFNKPLKSISAHHINEYKQFFSRTTPPATVNRRLSTMRTFFAFCLDYGIISENPTTKLTSFSDYFNPKMLLARFQANLEQEGAAKATIKNYGSDVRQFLTWLTQYAH